MRIVFFGSGKFGLPALEALKESDHDLLGVVTQPDRQKGRGLALAETPIKEFSLKNGLKVYQPEKINSAEAIARLKGLNADLFIVISYGQILGDEILSLPRKFCLNVHASLLPKYRGAAPINWAIIDGNSQAGVTVMKMVRQMDAGPLLLQKALAIEPFENALTLEEKLAKITAPALMEALRSVQENNYSLREQDASAISFARKLQKEDGRIDWNKSAEEIDRLIRGLIDWPGAFTRYQGKILKICQAKASPAQACPDSPLSPGKILGVNQEGILVAAGKDCLLIEELQLAGKKRMPAKEFIAGHKISPGECFQENRP